MSYKRIMEYLYPQNTILDQDDEFEKDEGVEEPAEDELVEEDDDDAEGEDM